MKPSFVPLLNRADLVVLVGFDCEHAFLPALLEASKNRASKSASPVTWIVREASRRLMCQSPPTIPRATCILTAILIICLTRAGENRVQNIYNALVATAPQYKADFTHNRNAYLAKLDAKIAEWEKEAAPLKGVKFISYHEHWPYFAELFGMDYIGTIELKPGIDPTRTILRNWSLK